MSELFGEVNVEESRLERLGKFIDKPVISILIALCFISGAVVLLSMIPKMPKYVRPNSLFYEGDIVVTKLGGYEAQILVRKFGDEKWRYQIRVNEQQVLTNTHLFSKDGPIEIKNLYTMWVDEWEIKKKE